MAIQKMGWFSKQMVERYGSVIYLDIDGKEVECTEVTNSPNPPFSAWNDLEPKGPVFDFVRRTRRFGSYDCWPYKLD